MSQRTITAREMLRFQACEQMLGCSQLTPEMRYEQALTAQRMRNFWSTATLQPRQSIIGTPVNKDIITRSPAFSDPLILTDLINLYDAGFSIGSGIDRFQMEVFEYGGEERSFGVDYFGLSGKVPQRYILKHEKNRSTRANPGGAVPDPQGDLPGRHIDFMPRLLAPYQQLEFRWNASGGTLVTTRFFLQVGMRTVRCLAEDNPYSYFTGATDRAIRNYIDGSTPETFFLEVQLPRANFPAVGATVEIRTPQMERPLLILGATSNVEGCQAELYDETKLYTFTFADIPTARIAGIPLYKAPPLALWACNSDLRNYNLYNMWPVPHLLESGTRLIVRLTNGLTPDEAGVFQETMLTRSEQPGRIAFICRTV
jgi:hypothetical protein